MSYHHQPQFTHPAPAVLPAGQLGYPSTLGPSAPIVQQWQPTGIFHGTPMHTPAPKPASYTMADGLAAYHYPSQQEQDHVTALAQQINDHLMMTDSQVMDAKSPTKFPAPIADQITDFLSKHEPLNFDRNPELGNAFSQAYDEYGGTKQGAALYTHLRSTPIVKEQLDEFPRAGGDKLPEIHHLIYKARSPHLAVNTRNLVGATRGGGGRAGSTTSFTA